MTWREHINVLSYKAITTLAFLRRNIEPYSSHIKAMSCLSYVKPIIEYLSTVWDPYIKEDIHKQKWYKEELLDLYAIIIILLIVSLAC